MREAAAAWIQTLNSRARRIIFTSRSAEDFALSTMAHQDVFLLLVPLPAALGCSSRTCPGWPMDDDNHPSSVGLRFAAP